MAHLTAYLNGIGLLGPGLDHWPAAATILAGQRPWVHTPTLLPTPALLPAAERRRSSAMIKLTLATGLEAAAAAGADVTVLPSVFSASGSDGNNCHEICETLASTDRQLSPTRFHNSVHNASAGYWSIATGAMAASSVLCARDGSFGAGLLEAMTQVTADGGQCLLLACDTLYPQPLHAVRPIHSSFGVALVLAADRTPASLARLEVRLVPGSDGPAGCMDEAGLEALRIGVPAARSLPLLRQIARKNAGETVIDYLDNTRLCIGVSLC